MSGGSLQLVRLELVDFRSFHSAVLEPDPLGTTVLTGANGSGKTTLLEAVAYAATLRSFRGAPREAMLRNGAGRAVVRAGFRRHGREALVETEFADNGRSRAQLNRQPVRSRRDLAATVAVTVFSPEDLALVQGGPAGRRELLDQALATLEPPAAALLDDVERVLRQRAALLRQAAGRPDADALRTLDIWDERLAAAGTALADRRRALVARLAPLVEEACRALLRAGAVPEEEPTPGEARRRSAAEGVELTYRSSWEGSLAEALAAARRDDLRRTVTTVGPHRDELVLQLAGRDARTQASQGQQRCVALSLRLAVHRLVTAERGNSPVLLLDDVFSELDPHRSRALVAALPPGQTLVTTAVPLPPGVAVARTVPVEEVARGATPSVSRARP